MDLSNITSLNSALHIIQSHGYLIIFVIMIIEGPLITYFAAFAASLGLFNIYWVFVLSVLGNLVTDMVYFGIGKFGNIAFIRKYIPKSKSRLINKLAKYIEKNTGKTLALIKIIPPLPTPGLILAGMSKLSFRKFFFYALLIGIPYSLFFTFLGYYSGVAFSTFEHYFKLGEVIIGILVVTILVFWFLFNRFAVKLIQKMKLS